MNPNPMHSNYGTAMESARSTDVATPHNSSYSTAPVTGNRLAGVDVTSNAAKAAAPTAPAVAKDSSSKLAEETEEVPTRRPEHPRQLPTRRRLQRPLPTSLRCRPMTCSEMHQPGYASIVNSWGVTASSRSCSHRTKTLETSFAATNYYQIQMMLTALRSRDLPENDPNDPQRMITVRLPKSLHEALCDEALRLGISVNRLCISRMLQLLDPKMIPETGTKPRGRKPRTRTTTSATAATDPAAPVANTTAGNGPTYS